MARSFVLGNGTILVDIDEHGQVRDFYFPYVGQENHVSGNIHRVGIAVDKQFSWLSSSAWQRTLTYQKNTQVTDIKAVHLGYNIELHFSDCVAHDVNIFLRKVTVKNNAAHKRSVTLFFHQKFDIFESNIGDTVFYNPFVKALIHYKGERYFLINGFYMEGQERHGFSNYATGLSGEFGREGTYIDAQDGVLSNNPIEHGSVDSTIAFDFSLAEKEERIIYYWLCVGKDIGEVCQLNGYIFSKEPDHFLTATSTYWLEWSQRVAFNFFGLQEPVIDLFRRSLMVIASHVDKHGSIIASSDSDVLFLRRDMYCYMWPRDGALIVRSLDQAGYPEISERFFRFCMKALTPFGYLFHKYRPDGSWGSSWHSWVNHGNIQLPIQEDQIGLVLDGLWKHFVQHKESDHMRELSKEFVEKVANFMLDFYDETLGFPKQSYDVWEEKLGIHTFTCAAVVAGLQAAHNLTALWGLDALSQRCLERAEFIKAKTIKEFFDEDKGYFIKGLYFDGSLWRRDMTIDASSCYGILHFNLLPAADERIISSYDVVMKTLKNSHPIGGYARYQHDNYYRQDCSGIGNPWIITTLWIAHYYIARATNQQELKPALDLFEWVCKVALPTGILPEQLEPCSGLPLSVAPLTWSHAELVVVIITYLEKLEDLGICNMCSPTRAQERLRS